MSWSSVFPVIFTTGPGMGTNPILMSLAIGGQLSRCWHAFREGGVIVATSICDGWFNQGWFPSYEETYSALQKYNTPAEFLDSDDALDITMNYEYRFAYSNRYTYHPYHAMSMITGGAVPGAAHLGRVHCGSQGSAVCPGNGFYPPLHIPGSYEAGGTFRGEEPPHSLHPGMFHWRGRSTPAPGE